MTIDDEDLIEIIPSDIELGADADGLPKTVAKELPKDKDGAPDIGHKDKPSAKETAAKKAEEDLVAALKRDKETAIAERDAERARATKAEADTVAAVEGRTKAEETASVRTEQAMRAHWERIHAHKQLMETEVATSENAATMAEREYQAAFEAQDGARMAKAQREIAKAEARITQVQAGFPELEREINKTRSAFEAQQASVPEVPEKKEPEKKEPAAPKYKTPDDWIDGEAKTFVGDDGAAWLKSHKDYVTDTAKNQQLLSFANYYGSKHGQSALKSAAFIKALDAEFFPDKQETAVIEDTEPEAEDEVAVETAPARKSAPSAPVSRNGKPAQASSGAAIKLNQDQYAIAPDIYPSYEDLSPETRQKFPAWSPTAARFQYHNDLKRAEKDNKFRI